MSDRSDTGQASALTMGLIGSSTKENERRVTVHPDDIGLIDPVARKRLYVERGYGEIFGVPDEVLEPQVAGLLTREELFERCDIVVIFKPTAGDFPYFREGQILWGAPHTVQNDDIVQLAIDRKLTYIAMESMFLWRSDGVKSTWIYHTQSELAGYCSVLHSQTLSGSKGWYDRPRKAAIISFGATARGAIHALRALDYTDVMVFTQRPPGSVLCTIPTVKYGQYTRATPGASDVVVQREDGSTVPFGQELAGYDIIVNCVLQDTDRPLMFIRDNELQGFKRGTSIVDVSCDTEMGFEWAKPTSFDEPAVPVGNGISYYAVDHSPSYLFNTASFEMSKATTPYVAGVLGGPDAWQADPTIGKAIEIDQGQILNAKILAYQHRDAEYPHKRA